MLHSLAAIAILALLSTPAMAEIKGCYDRVYDAAHLARHTGQKVTAMRLQYGFESGTRTADHDMNRLWVKFRGDAARYEAVVVCDDGAPPLSCGIEGDGGTFTLAETADGVKITNRDALRVNDPHGDEEGIEIPADAEHRVFLLKRISPGGCSG